MTQSDISSLKKWFLKAKRDFPWRTETTPYAVWVSEVMLQQTRAAVVIDYFKKWMQKFPTVQTLAEASYEEVIKTWEGLGYYSRARNLKEGAKYILDHHDGCIPSSLDALRKIKGIGPYTAGAILSFAFRQKAVAMDGNVIRVLSRYFLVEEEVSKPATKKRLEELAFLFLSDEEPWVLMEALIELGALVCQPAAKCAACPLQKGCFAYRLSKVDRLPVKKKKKDTVRLYRKVAIVFFQNNVLIEKKEEGKVLGGLFEFPSFDNNVNDLSLEFLHTFGLQIAWEDDLPLQQQSFTHHLLELYPSCYRATEKKDVKGLLWKSFDELSSLPFSSGHRRILKLLSEAIV
jgi:A/G-specific adenine glycosylase